VRCNAGKLNQVFMNLLLNASHAVAERGTITLRSRHEGDWGQHIGQRQRLRHCARAPAAHF
jgi:signal transduction histidine kinase